MKVKNDELGVSFSVPDRPTVLQQLEFSSGIFSVRTGNLYYRNWRAALAVIEDWECEAIPDPAQVFLHRADGDSGEGAIFMDEETSPTVARIMIYVGNVVAVHMTELEEIPKNS